MSGEERYINKIPSTKSQISMKSQITKKIFILITLILLVLQAGLVYFCLNFDKIFLSDKKEELPKHFSYFSKQEFYDEAYSQAANEIIFPDKKVYAGIIPHHLIVKDKIAAFFLGLENYDYKTVVLIGPNHFEKGNSNVILSQAKWSTPYGDIEPDLKLINKLAQNENYQIDESPFINEHSISGLVSFIKKSFPKAKIVPIILKKETSAEQSEFLANELLKYSNKEKTLIIASVDFSHELTTKEANEHDEISIKAIEDFNFSEIYSLDLDSPATIYTLLKYSELINAKKAQLLFHTNSGTLIGKEDEPGTSHNIFYFSEK